jgi:hypothetical protein
MYSHNNNRPKDFRVKRVLNGYYPAITASWFFFLDRLNKDIPNFNE